MPQVGRQLGQVAFAIDALPLPAYQRLDGEAVTHIVHAWPVAVGGATPAEPARELDEGGPDRPGGQPRPLRGDAKAGTVRDRIHAVAPLHLPTKRLLRGGMQR
jgi:hypothetical protein